MDRVVVLHAADLHLGGSVAVPDPAVARVAAGARAESLERMVALSAERGVGMVLLAGDVFDDPHPPLAARLALEKALAAWRDMGARVFIAPGNHDPFTPDSVWAAWPEDPNLHIFTPEPRGVALGDAGLWVAGVAHAHDRVSRDLSAGLPGPPEGLTGLAVLHCALAAAGGAKRHEPYAPAELSGLLAAPFAYWALGHVHRAQPAATAPLVVYAGTPQGAHWAEPGPRGVYLAKVSGASVTAEFHPLAPVVFQDLALDDLHQAATLSDLVQRVRQAYHPADGAWDFQRCLRLRLAGPCPLARQLWDEDPGALAETLKPELAAAGLVLELEGLYPALEPAELAGRDDVLGRLLRLIDQAGEDDELLVELGDKLARDLHPLNRGADPAERAAHLRGLLAAVRSLALRDLAGEAQP